LGKSVFYTLLPPPTQSFFTSIERCFYDCKYKKKQNILRGGGYILKILAAYIKICTYTKGGHYQKLYQKNIRPYKLHLSKISVD
jgi:hypothetical protein